MMNLTCIAVDSTKQQQCVGFNSQSYRTICATPSLLDQSHLVMQHDASIG